MAELVRTAPIPADRGQSIINSPNNTKSELQTAHDNRTAFVFDRNFQYLATNHATNAPNPKNANRLSAPIIFPRILGASNFSLHPKTPALHRIVASARRACNPYVFGLGYRHLSPLPGVMFVPYTGVRSAVHSERFQAAAVLAQRGGPLAAACGARTRTGSLCGQEPLAGGARCLRHAGPKAAAAHRERQLAGVRFGRVPPEVFARAEARRARNKLLDTWKRNPSAPGVTIDLGADEGRFQDALAGLGVQSGTGLPAVLDWLRWRFRRHMIDRADAGAWTRAVRDGLPGRVAAAGMAMQWVRLGDLDRRTKAGRAVMAALKTGGEVHAAALAGALIAEAPAPPNAQATSAAPLLRCACDRGGPGAPASASSAGGRISPRPLPNPGTDRSGVRAGWWRWLWTRTSWTR